MKLPLITIVTFLAAAACSRDAHADDTKRICADAYTQSQALRDSHKLRDARAQLRACTNPACPGFIVKECTSWAVDVDGRIPSVVLSASLDGGQVTEVVVFVDGNAVSQKLTGEAMEIDPGPHVFTFVAPDGTKMQKQVAVLEGQKAQAVSVTFPGKASAKGPDDASQELDGRPFWTPQRKVATAVAGIGVAGVVVGGVFAALTHSAVRQQSADCSTPTTCPNHAGALTEHSRAATDGIVSTIGFIGGGALVAAGGTLLLLGGAKSEPKPTPAGQLQVFPMVGSSVTGLVVSARF